MLPVTLIGLPGVGKSTFGRQAARLTGRTFHDSDRRVEENSGVSIAEIFARDGEPGFRVLEEKALAELIADPGPTVIAVGGGAVTHPPSFRRIRDDTHAIYLRSRCEPLAHRLRNDSRRPLLQGGDVSERLAELSRQRERLYLDAASAVIDVDALPRRAALRAIVEAIGSVSTISLP